jgi:hypothetical protein
MNVLFEVISNIDKRALAHLDKKLKAEFAQRDTILYKIFVAYKQQVGVDKIDDLEIRKKVYAGKSAGESSYYRMKNRLVDLINIYLSDIEFSNYSTADIANYLNLYKIFYQKGIYKLAKYYLEKAEKQAISSEQFEYLDIIYGLYIQLGKETLYNDPVVYIEKRKANSSMLSKIRQIDDILAVISYRLKVTQNLGEKINISKEVNKTIAKFSTDLELLNSVQFKIKMYKTISQIFVQQKEFVELEKYLRDTFDEFEKNKVFNKNTHDTKIEILIYIINTLLLLRKHAQALAFSETMHNALLQYDKVLYKKYIYFYYQVKIGAYSTINPDKAIETINEIINNKSIITNPYYSLLNYSNLAYLYYIKGSYNQVIRNLQKIHIHEFYEKADASLKVPLALLELITRIDMSDFDSFEYKLPQIKASLKNEWKSFEGPEKIILPLVEAIGTDPDFLKNKKLKEKARDFISSEIGNTELFNYNAWLTTKLKLDY